MVRSVQIHNLFLIDDIKIEFTDKLNVITGDSGSGKSIILKALSLLIETKSSATWLRDSIETGFIEAEILCNQSDESRMSNGSSSEYILRKEIKTDNRTRCFINDELVTKSELSSFAKEKIHFSLQDEIGLLRDNSQQLLIVDKFGNLNSKRNELLKLYTEYTQANTEFNRLLEEIEKKKSDEEWINLEYDELSSLNYTSGEQENLRKEREWLLKSQLYKQKVNDLLSLFQSEGSTILRSLQTARQFIQFLDRENELTDKSVKRLENIFVETKELIYDLQRIQFSLQENPLRLEEIEERLSNISEIERKWKIHIEDTSTRIESLKKQRSVTDNLLIQKAVLEKKNNTLKNNLEILGKSLSSDRTKHIEQLKLIVHKELPKLGLPFVNFDIILKINQVIKSTGYDEVDFQFSANPDRKIESISSIISGGELSRLELVILSNLKLSDHQTLIFDEIDRGVSGKIAALIGLSLIKLAQSNQVIVVSHLPQVAAAADRHIYVKKNLSQNVTKITHQVLAPKDRVDVIAAMLAGQTTKKGAVEGAIELLSDFHKEHSWKDL